MTIELIKGKVLDRVRRESESLPPSPAAAEMTSEFIHRCLSMNEVGDAQLFSYLFRNKFIFCKNTQEWFEWRGHYWKRDIMNRAIAAWEDVCERYYSEWKTIRAAELSDINEANVDDLYHGKKVLLKRLSERINLLRTDRRRQSCLKIVHTLKDPLAVTGEEFDDKPLLFPCANGVIDLETGRLHDGCPGDFLSLASPVSFLGIDAPAPLWEKSLHEIFNGNEDLIAYLQRLFGYAMTGLVTEKVFPVLYGSTGWNGRSMIVETISRIMGDMAGSIPAEMLLSMKCPKGAAGPSPDIMSLKGIRMAFASEVDEGNRFSASKIKWLTGKDELVGRNPHDKYQTRFNPTHKLFLMTNTQPQAPPNDKAFWERLHLIPFTVSFVNRDPRENYERRAIVDLDNQLLREAPGILAWLVRGCLLYQKHGLLPPKEVSEATEQYRRDEDILADFIDECLFLDPLGEEGASDLYGCFSSWYKKNIGKQEPSGTWFGKEFKKKFNRRKGRSGHMLYIGITIRNEKRGLEG